MGVLCCPDRTDLTNKKLLFLAGPNRFAPSWRFAEAVPYLVSRVPDDVLICSPARRDDRDAGPYSDTKKLEQMDWERDHLLAAARAGVWLFWLPLRESETYGHNYGQRTGHELALSATLRATAGLKMVIGAEDGYPGLASTLHTYEWFADSAPPLHSSLIETCNAALALL